MSDIVVQIGESLGVPFSEEQAKIILHKNAPLNVLSCAGSGKTTVLVARMLKREIEDRISPTNMLAITYTKKATLEMANRYQASRRKLKLRNKAKPTFKTFHALFKMLLMAVPRYRNVKVAKETKYKYALVKLIHGDSSRDKGDIFDSMIQYRSSLINKGISKDGIENVKLDNKCTFNIDNYLNVMTRYKELKDEDGVIDFEDMQVCLRDAILNREADEVIRNFRNIFLDIYIDEYQDISPIQTKILDMLMGKKTQGLVGIGDDDQSVYSFRGSDPKYIREFVYRYVGAKRLFLTENYRCKENILNPLIPSIERNQKRVNKTIQAHNEGGEIIGVPMGSGFDGLIEMLKNDPRVLNNPDDVAILVRQNNQRMLLADALASNGIPVDIQSTHWSLRQNRSYKVVQDVIKMIKEDDGYLFSEQSNKVFPHIRPNIYFKYKTNLQASWYQDVIVNDLYDTPKDIVKLVNGIRKSNNMANCIGYTWKLLKPYYQRLEENGYGTMSKTEEVVKHLFKIGKGVSLADFRRREQAKEDFLNMNLDSGCIQISTLHSVKGLEFDTVYMVGLDNDMFPVQSYSESEEEIAEMLEEERRLFYVGSTRAQNRLIYGYNEKNPTMFLKELDIDLPMITRETAETVATPKS